MRRKVLSCLTLVWLVVASCGSGDGDSKSKGDPLAYGVLPTDRILHPVTDHNDTSSIVALREARRNVAQMCLTKVGYTKFLGTDEALVPEAVSNPIDGNDAFAVQRAWVEKNGYGIASGLVPEERTVQPPPGLSGDSLAEFYDRQDECLKEAIVDLPMRPEPATEVDVIVRQVADRISSDRSWLAAFGMWSPCMRDRGYQFAERSDAFDAARNAVKSATSAKKAHADEVRIALADFECQLSAVIAPQRQIERTFNEASGLI